MKKQATRLLAAFILFGLLSGQVVNAAPIRLIAKQEKAVKEKKINKQDKITNLSVVYPVVGQEKIDASIKQYIDDLMKDFQDSAYTEGKVNWKNELSVKYDTKRFDNYLSVRFRIYQFTGGAHGMDSLIVKNYNLQDGSEVKLTDLFKNDSNYLKRLSELTVPQLAGQMKNKKLISDFKKDKDLMQFIYDGAAAKEDNFANFYFVDNGLIFHFNRYAVAPYAHGEFEVKVPFIQVIDNLQESLAKKIKEQVISQLKANKWLLSSVNQAGKKQEVSKNKWIFNFDNQKLSGKICNNIFGNYSLENNILKSLAASTMMYCQPESTMLIESQIIKAISDGVEIGLNDKELRLIDQTSKTTFMFKAIK